MSKNIDKIFYINLNKRSDRKDEIENELTQYDLLDKSERYEAIYTPHSGIVGCGYSHLNVLKLAKERNYQNVLILEDDFTFVVSKDEVEESLSAFFDSIPDYDVCMISYIVQKSQPIPNNTLVGKVLDGQTASGYIVNNKYLDSLIQLYEWAIPLLEKTNEHWNYANDHVWKKLQSKDNWYYLLKRLGKQRDGYSDNKMAIVTMND